MLKKIIYVTFSSYFMSGLLFPEESANNNAYAQEWARLNELNARADEIALIDFKVERGMEWKDIISQPVLTVDDTKKLTDLCDKLAVLNAELKAKEALLSYREHLDDKEFQLLLECAEKSKGRLRWKIYYQLDNRTSKMGYFRWHMPKLWPEAVIVLQALDVFLEETEDIKKVLLNSSSYLAGCGGEDSLSKWQHRLNGINDDINEKDCVISYRKSQVNDQKGLLSATAEDLKRTSLFALKDLTRLKESIEQIKVKSKKINSVGPCMEQDINMLADSCDKLAAIVLYKWKTGVAVLAVGLTAAVGGCHAAYKELFAKKKADEISDAKKKAVAETN
ncbi:hypothetical protein IPH25_01330 [bacterium]|nr:MAG: hypothetical protein IPG37_03455 [bacterium]QQR62069.1 MAG: hypothetical protein IPH25_01330 [bacterium]QQR62337.1 MAG: hypothetical protein IPH67_02805 [bacterium]